MAMVMLMLILIILFSLLKTQNVHVVTLSAKDNQNFLANDLKDQLIGSNVKQNVRLKIQQMNIVNRIDCPS